MQELPDISAPQEPAPKRVRVRRKRRRFSSYNQFGISRRDLAIGLVVLFVIGGLLAWFLYSTFIKGPAEGQDDGGNGPDIAHPGDARF